MSKAKKSGVDRSKDYCEDRLNEEETLKAKLIVREMLNGNDCTEQINKIKEIGLLKTMLGNNQLKLAQSGMVEDFLNENAKSYSQKQREQLYTGIVNGIDVNPYFDESLSEYQMCGRRLEIEVNLEYELYEFNQFNDEQILILKLCMQQGIDVGLIADPSISAEYMVEIRDRILDCREKKSLILSKKSLNKLCSSKTPFLGVFL